MINTFTKDRKPGKHGLKLAMAAALVLILAGCGKESSDGTVSNALLLPTDNVLNLYCIDIGIFNEKCVLDDPDNPYARAAFVTDDPSDDENGQEFNNAKFSLANAAPSPKAKFYVYATALARAPSGENQWYTARALHELYTASGSALIREQTIKAYRSALDNFFSSATFFEATFLATPGIFYPVLIRDLSAADLAMTPAGFTPLFDPAVAGNNEFIARETLGGWGYTWVGMLDGPGGPASVPGPVTRN